MLFLAYATLLVVGYAVASPQANQYVDNVLNVALQNELRMQNLDPAPLSNFNVEFYDKIKIIGKVKGNADFTNGSLTGLSRVRRSTECQGPYYTFGQKAVNCTIAFNDLIINYDGKMKYGKMPKINIKGSANVTTTAVFMEVVSAGMNSPATLKSFQFQQIGQLNTKFTGLGPLNRFMKFLEDGFKQHAQAQIFNSVSQRFQTALNRAVNSVVLPN